MTPERWQQVKATLAEALEHPTATRHEFLAVACADDTNLRGEVQSLLNQPADEFDLCAESAGLRQPDRTIADEEGKRLGAYQLVREIGRGGMGAVWLAHRVDQQFEKLVAIKLLKRGTDTDEVLRRFSAERQILARLEHPNIARLLDAGTSPDGLPYFVMELVEGTQVTEFVSANALPIIERLQLFQKICAAVQFAHQNLVVHRDLKPTNILITADGEPKLLDFGIAKLLASSDDAWEMTQAGQARLTPRYASPEQVRGESVTTVSDVYSLGALLYELLAETPAHRFKTAHPSAAELLRIVETEELVRPSVATRNREMQRHLRGDLDTIILRALAKVPARRYSSAGNLADDIRRYLDGRPVRARPDTVGYRTGKFLRRNKTAVAAAVVLATSLIGGAAGTLWQARRAERRFNDVRKIANSLMFEFHDAIRDLPGALPARQLVTQRALEYLDNLAQEAGNDLSLQSELAIAYQRIGRLTFDQRQAVASHEKSVRLGELLVQARPKSVNDRQQLSESYSDLSDALKIGGHSAASIECARKSLALVQALAAEVPSDAMRNPVARSYIALAIALIDAGDATGALDANKKAQPILEAYVAQHPSDWEARRTLSGVYSGLSGVYEYRGDCDQALKFSLKEFSIAQEMRDLNSRHAGYQRDMWAAHFRIARQLAALGDLAGAAGNYASATAIIEKLAAADPEDKGHRRWLAVTYSYLGDFQASRGETDAAFKHYQKSIAISKDLMAEDIGRVEARRDLTRTEEAVGRLLIRQGQLAQGCERLREAESLAVSSVEQDPQNTRIRSKLADISEALAAGYTSLAEAASATPSEQAANLEVACRAWQRSVDLLEQIGHEGMLTPLDDTKLVEVKRQMKSCVSL